MKIQGIKATGFGARIMRSPEIEMVSGSETYTRRSDSFEFSIKLETTNGVGSIRLTLNEAEARDWHMRLSRVLASHDGFQSQALRGESSHAIKD